MYYVNVYVRRNYRSQARSKTVHTMLHGIISSGSISTITIRLFFLFLIITYLFQKGILKICAPNPLMSGWCNSLIIFSEVIHLRNNWKLQNKIYVKYYHIWLSLSIKGKQSNIYTKNNTEAHFFLICSNRFYHHEKYFVCDKTRIFVRLLKIAKSLLKYFLKMMTSTWDRFPNILTLEFHIVLRVSSSTNMWDSHFTYTSFFF